MAVPEWVGRLVMTGIGFTTLIQAAAAVATETQVKTQEGVGYWTADRLRNALPMSLPNVTHPVVYPPPPASASPDSIVSVVSRTTQSHRPTEHLKPKRKKRLFMPKKIRIPLSQSADTIPVPEAAGSEPAPFSSSRVVPLSGDTAFPYSAVGRLFFTVPATADENPGDRFCSAAVIARRIVLTAGHCLHSGKNGADGWFTNWRFIPAYRDGTAPYGSWDASQAKVTETWANGSGELPNAADYGLLVFPDREVNRRVRALGNAVGVLGIVTGHLQNAHVHMLGYPCNIDNCDKMHLVSGQIYRTAEPNNVEAGSDMGPGSSGGPWVLNFGVPGNGQIGGIRDTGMNKIAGLISYGYNSNAITLQGSPNLDERLWDLYDQVCAAASGNC